MSRAQQWLVFAIMVIAIAGAALVGRLGAPDARLRDPRHSTMLTGPAGTRALATTLSLLGVRVERQRRSFIGMDTLPPSRNKPLIALLDPPGALGPTERKAILTARERGQPLFVAGDALYRCFGFAIQFPSDSVKFFPVKSFPRDTVGSVEIDWVLVPTKKTAKELQRGGCPTVYPIRVDTLMMSEHDNLVAAKLTFRQGAPVTLLSDPVLLSNKTFKEADGVGELVIPWFISDDGRGVSFDEYHQGFGEGGSLWKAALGWSVSRPGGWALLQLIAAGLVALALAAVRFGPIKTLPDRHRRSPLEHVEALATGLERSRATEVARQRLVGGLRRRLASRGMRDGWLSTTISGATPEVAAALQRLNAGNLRDAAIAVEDAWEAMERPEKRQNS